MMVFFLIVLVVIVGAVGFVSLSGRWSTLPVQFPAGTRAWEAELTMGPLRMAIEQRSKERDTTTDMVRRDKLDRQIKFLTDQVDQLQKIIDDRDISPGRGYIGFEAPPEN